MRHDMTLLNLFKSVSYFKLLYLLLSFTFILFKIYVKFKLFKIIFYFYLAAAISDFWANISTWVENVWKRHFPMATYILSLLKDNTY